MQQLFRMRDAEGNDYDVPASDMNEFKGAVPNATAVTRHRGKDGAKYDVPEADTEEFRGAVPDATPVRRVAFANGEMREFTLPEMTKFLRSKEWREDEKYKADRDEISAKMREQGVDPEQGSVGWAGTKGAVAGAAEGAFKGGLRALGKELGAFVGVGTGIGRLAAIRSEHKVNKGILNAMDAIDGAFDWFAEDLGVGQKSGSGFADAMSAVGEGGSSMMAGLLPWMVPALLPYNIAASGGSSFGQTFNDLVSKGVDEETAYGHAIASGGLSMAGAYLMGKMPIQKFLRGFGVKVAPQTAAEVFEKTGEIAKKAGADSFKGLVDNVAKGKKRQEVVQHLVGAAEMGGITGVQDMLSSIVHQHGELSGKDENGKPIRDEVSLWEAVEKGLESAGHGVLTGAVMAGIHGAEHGVRRKMYREKARAEVVEWQRNAPPEELRELNPEKFDELARKRAEGKDISREDASAAGLSPDEGAKWRNGVFDEYNEAAKARKARITDEQSYLLDDSIKEVVDTPEQAKAIREAVERNVTDATDINDPAKRQALIEKAAKDIEAERAKAEKTAAVAPRQARTERQEAARDPQTLRDPAFREWARRNGRTATPFARRAYDREQIVKAEPVLKRAFKGLKFVYHDKVEDPTKWTKEHPEGTQRQIAGVEGARRMGIGKLDRAELMEKSGMSREDIWRETGWWRGIDGKWRIEVKDPKARSTNKFTTNKDGDVETNLYNLVSAPELRKAGYGYPTVFVIFTENLADKTLGQTAMGGDYVTTIRLRKSLMERLPDGKIRLTEKGHAKLVHEVQHIIQYEEEMARGAGDREVAAGTYRATAGEVEARNVERRLRMTPEERRANPPWTTEDVPAGDQILRMIVDKKSGETLGWYTSDFKELHLNPGANLESVTHELLHAAQDWAKINSPKLAKALDDIARDCPDRLKRKILRAYGVVSPEVIMKEWGAFNFMGGSLGGRGRAAEILRAELARRENLSWAGRFWQGVKDIWKDMLTKMGGNRVDLSAIDTKTPQEAMDYIARAMAEGKTFGEVKKTTKPVKAIDMKRDLTLGEKWQANLHNYRDPLRVLRDEMAERGAKFNDATDFYELSRLQKGKDQAAVNEANRKIGEYLDLIERNGLKHEEVVEFMQAQAAPDRNAMVKKRNGRENGSGMTDAEAAKTLRTFEQAGKGDALREVSDFLLTMQEEGMQYRVDKGLMDAETAQAMIDREPYHVPFRSAVDPMTGDYIEWGSGKSMEKPEFKKAQGRETLADDVVGWMFSEYVDAHTRGNENEVRSRLADAMRLNPKLGVGRVLRGGEKKSAYDYQGVVSKVVQDGKKALLGKKAAVAIVDDPRFRESRRNGDGGMKNVLAFKEGGKTHYIEFAEGPRGERIQAAVNGRDLAKMPGWVNKATRFWSSTATEWSPTFAFRNLTADNLDILGNYVGDYGLVNGTKAYGKHVANGAKMLPGIEEYARTGKIPKGETGEWIRRFEKAGGSIAGYTNEGYGDVTAKIDARIRKGDSKTKAIVGTVAKFVPRTVETLNKTSELLNRISSFRTSVEMGMSDQKAALWSRESTVDFNMKGNWTGISNALWMFSNSSLGASARQMKAIFKSKYGASLVGSLLGYGIVEGAMEVLMNGDEKEAESLGKATGKDVGEYTRANSVYIRKGDKIYRLPFHAGPFSYIKYIGNCAARMALGALTAEEAGKELAKEGLGQMTTYLGMGNTNWAAQSGKLEDDAKTLVVTAAPWMASPFLQGAFNLDYAGRSIYNEGKFNQDDPDAYAGRRHTPQYLKDTAIWLNEVTGGNEHKQGALDLPPEVLKLVAEGVGKNLLRDVLTAGATAATIFGDEPYDIRNVPVGRDFIRTADGNDNRFYDALKDYNTDKNDIVKNRPNMTAEERKAVLTEKPYLKRIDADAPSKLALDPLKDRIARLRKMEDGYWYVNGKAKPHEWPQEKLDEFKEKRRKLQADFIKRMGR